MFPDPEGSRGAAEHAGALPSALQLSSWQLFCCWAAKGWQAQGEKQKFHVFWGGSDPVRVPLAGHAVGVPWRGADVPIGHKPGAGASLVP